MSHFRGPSPLNLDAKGRMAMPTKYRDALLETCGGKMFVTLSRNKCLTLYPEPKWLEIETQFEKAVSNDPAFEAFRQLYVGSAVESQMDGQGRISLPQLHREFAGLEKRVVLIGVLFKFEVWDEQTWWTHTRSVMDSEKMQMPEGITVSF